MKTSKKHGGLKNSSSSKKKIIINVADVFTNSFTLLVKEPKLFLPKIIIAILYGISIYIEVGVFLEVLAIASSPSPILYIAILNELLIIMLALLIYNLFVYVADIFANSLYPTLVEQLEHGKISLTESVIQSKKHFGTMFVSATIPLILLFVLTLPFSFIAAAYKDSSMIINFFLIFVVGYIFIMLFYFLYPVVMLGKKPSLASLSETITLSLKHKKKVFFLSIVPFFVTILKTISAFLAQDTAFLPLFVLLVLLTGIVYTYHMVMNPYLYLKVK